MAMTSKGLESIKSYSKKMSNHADVINKALKSSLQITFDDDYESLVQSFEEDMLDNVGYIVFNNLLGGFAKGIKNYADKVPEFVDAMNENWNGYIMWVFGVDLGKDVKGEDVFHRCELQDDGSICIFSSQNRYLDKAGESIIHMFDDVPNKDGSRRVPLGVVRYIRENQRNFDKHAKLAKEWAKLSVDVTYKVDWLAAVDKIEAMEAAERPMHSKRDTISSVFMHRMMDRLQQLLRRLKDDVKADLAKVWTNGVVEWRFRDEKPDHVTTFEDGTLVLWTTDYGVNETGGVAKDLAEAINKAACGPGGLSADMKQRISEKKASAERGYFKEIREYLGAPDLKISVTDDYPALLEMLPEELTEKLHYVLYEEIVQSFKSSIRTFAKTPEFAEAMREHWNGRIDWKFGVALGTDVKGNDVYQRCELQSDGSICVLSKENRYMSKAGDSLINMFDKVPHKDGSRRVPLAVVKEIRDNQRYFDKHAGLCKEYAKLSVDVTHKVDWLAWVDKIEAIEAADRPMHSKRDTISSVFMNRMMDRLQTILRRLDEDVKPDLAKAWTTGVIEWRLHEGAAHKTSFEGGSMILWTSGAGLESESKTGEDLKDVLLGLRPKPKPKARPQPRPKPKAPRASAGTKTAAPTPAKSARGSGTRPVKRAPRKSPRGSGTRPTKPAPTKSARGSGTRPTKPAPTKSARGSGAARALPRKPVPPAGNAPRAKPKQAAVKAAPTVENYQLKELTYQEAKALYPKVNKRWDDASPGSEDEWEEKVDEMIDRMRKLKRKFKKTPEGRAKTAAKERRIGQAALDAPKPPLSDFPDIYDTSDRQRALRYALEHIPEVDTEAVNKELEELEEHEKMLEMLESSSSSSSSDDDSSADSGSKCQNPQCGKTLAKVWTVKCRSGCALKCCGSCSSKPRVMGNKCPGCGVAGPKFVTLMDVPSPDEQIKFGAADGKTYIVVNQVPYEMVGNGMLQGFEPRVYWPKGHPTWITWYNPKQWSRDELPRKAPKFEQVMVEFDCHRGSTAYGEDCPSCGAEIREAAVDCPE